ncbi:MAG: hypothetical protein ACRDTJ_21075 [Pseudonocardiaceae bacterium]
MSETYYEYALRYANGYVRDGTVYRSLAEAEAGEQTMLRMCPPDWRDNGVFGPFTIVAQKVTLDGWRTVEGDEVQP